MMREATQSVITGEVKGVVASELAVGVDIEQVDLISARCEIGDQVARGGRSATVGELRENEGIAIGAAGQSVTAAKSCE
jgi:hypothetical protein